ncbi:MAG: hypothetical protein OEO84_14460, partial [Betaproteobacteria bacterium]|nr:hypothetical protein [Betaproteobacteria bacterium]
MRRALFFALAFVLPAAHAQLGTNTILAPTQAPQITVQPLQSPVITNTQPTLAQPAGRPLPGQAAQPQLLQLVPAEEQVRTTIAEADPKAEANDFQEFIQRSTGQLLPLYGYDLFRAPTT